MTLSLPQAALEYLDKRADELLSLLAFCPEQPSGERIKSSLSHVHMVKVQPLNAEIGITRHDPYGKEMERYFKTPAGFIGLSEEPYARLRQLVDQFANRSELIDLLSDEFIKDVLLEWLRKRYLGEIGQVDTFGKYLEQRADQEVKARRIDIPISFLAIEQPFQLGNVTLDFYTKEFWDEFEKRLREGPRADAADKIMEQKRRKYQGAVFTSHHLTAEPRKSIEIAMRETGKSLMVLRFFSPSALLPRYPSYFGMMGHTFIPTDHSFMFSNHVPMERMRTDSTTRPWLIRAGDILGFKNNGFDQASQMIAEDNPSGLENVLLATLDLFGKAVTAHDYRDKLVFMLASLETMLLRDASEPIQNSLGLRLAFLTETTPEKRAEIKKLVADAYKLRSGYLHHGLGSADLEILDRLASTAWCAIRNVLVNKPNQYEHLHLLDYLDKKILS